MTRHEVVGAEIAGEGCVQTPGGLGEASPVVCQHERILLPVADRVGNRLWARRDSNFLHKHYNPAFPVLSFAEQIVMQEREHAT